MKQLPDSEKALKKSISMPPELWAYVQKHAGDLGNPSKVIQKAIRLLEQESQKAERASKAAFQAGKKEIQKSLNKKRGA
jgi:Arc/MetJ-type ribon-helix-helix transcriptional regulator